MSKYDDKVEEFLKSMPAARRDDLSDAYGRGYDFGYTEGASAAYRQISYRLKDMLKAFDE